MNEQIHNERQRQAIFVIIIGIISNIALFFLKVLVGYLSGYQALIASGIHSLSDTVSDVFAVLALKISSRKADTHFHYGYRRIETIASLIASFLLLYAVIELVLHSLGHEENDHGDVVIKYKGWIIFTVLFVMLIKESLFHYARKYGIRLNSPLLIAKAWHHRTDAASSLVVLISVLVGYLLPHAEFIDTIATIIVSGFILHAAWEIGSDAIKELIDYAPSTKIMALVEEITERFPAITFIHNIRIRTLGGALCVELTAEVDGALTVTESYHLAEEIQQELQKDIDNIMDVSIKIAPKGEYIRKFHPELLD